MVSARVSARLLFRINPLVTGAMYTPATSNHYMWQCDYHYNGQVVTFGTASPNHSSLYQM